MTVSDRYKSAFKVALAMTITYGIALSMNWEKPFWAGLSVAFCSLETAGESINRGIHRVLGTFLAGVATVMMMAFFPQQRWPFLFCMSAFIALCTYRMSGGSRFSFIWFNAGFNVPILAMLGGPVGLNSFDIIVLRVQETTLGVVVYSLVAVLLWPQRGGAGFEKSVRNVCDAQRQLFERYLSSISGKPEEGGAAQLRDQIAGQLASLGGRLEGAIYDSDEIWAVRHAWRRCLSEISSLSKNLECWRQGFPELNGLPLHLFIAEMSPLCNELKSRFSAIDTMLGEQPPPQQPRAVVLKLDQGAMGSLTHIERAAVLLCHDQLTHLDNQTKRLFETISEIRGYGRARKIERVSTPKSSFGIIDLDRLAGVVRQSAALWLTLLMVIYVPAFPNPIGVAALTNAFAMVLTNAPFIQASVLLVPTIMGSLFAGLLYLFVMPHLPGFGELGIMIFMATFLICYVFHKPKAALAKAMGLCMLVIVIGVENQQSFNFLYFANWFMAGVLFVLALIVAWRFPISFKAEDRFLAMFNRFNRSARFLFSVSPGNTWRRTFCGHDVNTLPRRIRPWGRVLPRASLGDSNPDQVQALTASLQVLSDQIQALLDVRLSAQSELLTKDLKAEIEAWHVSVQEILERLIIDPATANDASLRNLLDARLMQLEGRIEKVLDKAAREAIASVEAALNLYRLLGVYRGVSEELMNLIKWASQIDWNRLRETRF